MSNVVDLSTLAAKAKEGPNLDELSPEERAEIEALAEGVEDAGQPVRTAFLIVVGEDGHAIATSDLEVKLNRQFMPNMHDMYGAAAQVIRDIETADTANTTAMIMQQMAQYQMEQRMNQQINNQIQQGLKG